MSDDDDRRSAMIDAVFPPLGGPAFDPFDAATRPPDEYLALLRERDRPEAKNARAIAWVRANEPVSADEVHTLMATVGRNPAAWLFADLFELGLLPDDALGLVVDAWQMCEFPGRAVRRRDWVAMFQAAGYRHDDAPAERPAEPLTLYRGAPTKYRRGMSWTSSRETAEWFHERNQAWGYDSAVWVAQVPPTRLHCRIDDRKEAEYVVNPNGLRVERAT